MTAGKTLVWAAAVMALAAAGAAAWLAGRADAPPRIEFPETIRFGELAEGEMASGELVIANRGGSPLRVGNVSTSCSCSGLERAEGDTFVAVTELTVPPGQSVPLRVRLAARGQPGQPLHTLLAFATNDPSRPTSQIDIVVSRIRGIARTPAAVVFGRMTVGQVQTQRVEVRDLSGEPLAVESATSTTPGALAVRVLPRGGADGKYDPSVAGIEVTAAPTAPGIVQGDARLILTCSGERKTIAVPVSARVVPPVEVSPNRLALPRASGDGALYHGTCLCLAASGQPLILTPVEVPPAFAVTIQEGGGAACLVRIEWRSAEKGATPGTHVVRLRAEADGRAYPLEIRVDCGAKGG